MPTMAEIALSRISVLVPWATGVMGCASAAEQRRTWWLTYTAIGIRLMLQIGISATLTPAGLARVSGPRLARQLDRAGTQSQRTAALSPPSVASRGASAKAIGMVAI